ncbi:ammonium transporter [Millisia brevis]|uniref:ammonium transporter n=1 Tax=Millisia brevis TaxID=264148 RepID=UPI0034E226C9
MRRLTATAALAIGSLAVWTGTALADPTLPADPPAAEQGAEEIGYEAHIEDETVVTTLDAGAFRLADDGKTVTVQDSQGADVLVLPLTFYLGDQQLPLQSEITEDGKVLKLIPGELEPAVDKPAGLFNSVASPLENQRATNEFSTQLGLATGIGSLVGTIAGAVIGCVATIPLGCIPGLLTGAAVGGIAGTILAGGPTLIAAGYDLVNTLNAPPGSTRWA